MKHALLQIVLAILYVTSVFGNNIDVDFSDTQKEFIKNNPIIKVGIEKDWPPFDFTENGKYTGLAKDYLDEISRISNLKFEYYPNSWDNLLQEAKNKKIDLLPILAKDKSREEFLLFTKSYLTIRDYVFSTKNQKITNIEELKNKTLAIPKGYIQESFFKENYPNIKIYLTESLLDSIDAVITKRADFLVSNIAIINYLTKKHNIVGLKPYFHMGYDGNNLHMAVRNDYEILRQIIQKSISHIPFDKINEISTKWMDNDINSSSKKLKLSLYEKEFLIDKKKIVVANELDWYPFDFNENEIPKGYVIDYIKLISKKIGINIEYKADRWSFLIEAFKNKEIDVLPVISYNKSREDFLYFTQSFMSQKLSIITKESVNDIINMDDLKSKKVGMIKGWNLTNILKDEYPRLNVIEFDSLEDIFEAIKKNFIDATIQNKLLAKYYINKNYNGYLKTSANVNLDSFNDQLYMGIRKDLKPLHTIFKKAIASITDDELDSLNKKWINYGRELIFTKEEQSFIDNNIVNAITTDNWAPFNFSDNQKIKGISLNFWQYVVDKSKIKSNLKDTNRFPKALSDLRDKKIDVVLAASRTKDRDKYAIFSDSYSISPIGIATLQDKNYIKDAKELLGKKIAVGKNFSAHKLLEEKYPNMDFHFVNTVEEGLELLSENKVYAYVDIMPVLTYNIKTLGFTNIKIAGDTGIDFNLRFMIRDDYTILRSIINKTLSNMSYEEKSKIIDKWLDIEIEKSFDYSVLAKTVSILLIIIIFVLYKNRQLQKYQRKLEKTQTDLKDSLNNFEALIDFNIAGIAIVQNKNIIYLNSELVSMLNYKSKDDLMNKNINNILIHKEKENNLDELKDLFESYNYEAIKNDNKRLEVAIKSKEIKFYNKKAFIVSIVDLTEIKKNEEVIIQQSKMASLGEMIGNIAHQWRQPLSSISTIATGLKLQKEYGQLSDEDLNNHLDGITETTKFLSDTIDDFRNYIKTDKEKKEFKLTSSINKVLSIMRSSFSNHFIKVENNVKESDVFGYENELNQILLNILSNSTDALKEIDDKDRAVFLNSYDKNNNTCIEIIDSGGGVKEEIKNKVFEPYFTTKHQSQGTGLGLYMTHKILTESFNGSISIDNCEMGRFKKCTKILICIPKNQK